MIKYVLISHGHPDHFGSARFFEEHYNGGMIMVIGYRLTRDKLVKYQAEIDARKATA